MTTFKSFFVKEESENEAKDFKTKNNPPEKTVVNKTPAKATSIEISSIESSSNISDTVVNTAPAADLSSTSGKSTFVKFYMDQIAGAPAIGHYLEFINAMKEVEGLATDEKTKFQMIYAPFKTQKVSVQDLVNAGKKYMELCGQKKADLEGGYKQGVAQRDATIKNLTDENAKIEKQMQDLNSKKLENLEKIKITTDEKSKLEGKKTDFNSAYTEVTDGIQSNIDKITTHLVSSIPANQ